MSKKCIALACAVGLLTAVSASAQDSWHPSKWGADDQIGAANLLTPEKVLEAVKLVKTGKAYPLGIAVGRDTPAFPPRSIAVTVLAPNQYQGATLAENKMTYNDDMITGWLGVGTQIDGLGHLGVDNVYSHGLQAKDFVKVTGLEKLGIEQIPPIVTRGVLIDMAKHKGVEMMTEGQVISADDVKAAMQAQDVTVGKGDVIVFHTGWLAMLAQDPKRFAGGEPGIDAEAATFLATLEPVAVGADTWGIEAVPFANASRIWEGHQVLLAKNGIYILETLDTRAMIADGVKEFLFVLGQPRYKGAVQAIINPVAIH